MDLRLVISKLIEKNISTLTLLAGIPATIGGAIYMNAGANGYTISEDLLWVKFIYEGKIVKANKDELSFGYRESFFKRNNTIILEAAFKVISDINTIDVYREVLHKRRTNQPLNYPNSGSIFRNFDDIKSYEVIRKLEIVDCMMGGAKFSEKHANFIVNVNKAKSKDIINLIEYAKEKAKNMLNIELKEEVILLNFKKKTLKFNYGKNKK
jgi:UDP-N-acetylmuramate dehydrogenase